MPGTMYSVIIPVYNSQNTLEELFERIDKCFEQHQLKYELIFVDDGSEDHSWQVLRKLKENYNEKIKAIRFVRNFGQHNAVFCGLSYATGEFIITLDDDLQHPPEEIPKLIEKHKKTSSELVYGFYKKKKHSPIKELRLIKIKTTYLF